MIQTKVNICIQVDLQTLKCDSVYILPSLQQEKFANEDSSNHRKGGRKSKLQQPKFIQVIIDVVLLRVISNQLNKTESNITL